MGRAPCCDKVGLNRGPWTPEEDQILISFVQKHGHTNWRALPKQAGLLRCGKSCRLRWINYLKPDIKRGNFTKEEEDTIIQLHEMMGNRWSAIAARLPGRTDNEIKNVWHTHLKKKLQNYETTKPQGKRKVTTKRSEPKNTMTTKPTSTNTSREASGGTSDDQVPTSSQQSYYSSDGFSSMTEVSSLQSFNDNEIIIINDDDQYLNSQQSNLDYFAIIDDSFWSAQEMSSPNDQKVNGLENIIDDSQLELSFLEKNSTPGALNNFSTIYNDNNGMINYEDNMDFWFDVFVEAGGEIDLPAF